MTAEAAIGVSQVSLLRQDVAGPLLDRNRQVPDLRACVRGVCGNLLAVFVYMELLHALPVS